MASTSSSKTLESWTLALVRTTASGTPFRSETIWRFEPGLPLSFGFFPVFSSPFAECSRRVERCPLLVYLFGLSEAVQEHPVQLFPHPGLLPVAQASTAGTAGATAHLLGEHLPGDAALEDEDDASQGGPIFDPWPTASGLWRFGRQQRFYELPQLVGDKFFAHADERTIHSRAGLARYFYCRGSTSRSGVGRLPRRSTRPKAPSSRGSCNGRKSAPRAPWSGARRPMPETTACRRASARRPGTPPNWRPSEVSAGALWRTLRPVPCGFALVSRSLSDLPGSRRTSLANHRTRGCPSESTTVAGGRRMALHTSKIRAWRATSRRPPAASPASRGRPRPPLRPPFGAGLRWTCRASGRPSRPPLPERPCCRSRASPPGRRRPRAPPGG